MLEILLNPYLAATAFPTAALHGCTGPLAKFGPLLREGAESLQNGSVAGAAAQVSGERRNDFITGRTRVFLQKCFRGDQNPWGAVSALSGPEICECFLQGVKVVTLHHSLDGENLAALALSGQFKTAENRLAIDQDRACSALSQLTTMLGPGQLELLAQNFQQRMVD